MSGNNWWQRTGSINMAQNTAAGCQHGMIPTLQFSENSATYEMSLICIATFSIVSEYKENTAQRYESSLFFILGENGKSSDTYH